MTAAQQMRPIPDDDWWLLELGAVYLSPAGRPCRLGARPWGGKALLLYDLADGSPAPGRWCDGFNLQRENWHLLRRVS